jgi:hypothetical protein
MIMDRSLAVGLFVSGLLTGGAMSWTLGVLTERYRKARSDFRSTRNKLRDLLRLIIDTVTSMIKWGLGVAFIVYALVTVVRSR